MLKKNNMARVLLIDDDAELVLSLSRALRAQGLPAEIEAATSGKSALNLFRKSSFEVVVLDLCLDESIGVESGLNLLYRLKSLDSAVRIIVLTGHGSVEHGISSLSFGAANFLEKPANILHLKELIVDGISQAKIRRDFEKLRTKNDSVLDDFLIGTSLEMQKVKNEIKFAASNSQSVLLLGETGTGKGLCARAIHSLSERKHEELVLYQPNYSSTDLVNSDLFGHKSGSFTGADSDRQGLLSRANKGTLFLDEIDSLPLDSQILLLGVLQDKEYRPIGSDTRDSSDFRLISATNAELETKIEEKVFREDFFHRIAQLELKLPPLRKRKEDIPMLGDHFLRKLCKDESLNVFSIEEAGLEFLMNQAWPGNVRQLESVIVNAAYRAKFDSREVILYQDIRFKNPRSAKDQNFRERVEAYKVELINSALEKHAYNQSNAARDIGLDRSTMRRILLRNQ